MGDLVWLSSEEARTLEPEVRCAAALFSPSTGILDSHAFMLTLQGDIENAGGVIPSKARWQAEACKATASCSARERRR